MDFFLLKSAIHIILKMEESICISSEILPSTLRLKVLLLSPAVLDATQVYLPVSITCALLI